MPTTQHQLPHTAPNIVEGSDVGGSDFLPLILYSLDTSVPQASLQSLATELEQDYVIEVDNSDSIHLVQIAPASLRDQTSLESTLENHIKYVNENVSKLEYFPWCFLVAHDKDWATQGIWLVYVDFEEEHKVTAFRLRVADVGGVCRSLRDDDEGVEVLEERYRIDE